MNLGQLSTLYDRERWTFPAPPCTFKSRRTATQPVTGWNERDHSQPYLPSAVGTACLQSIQMVFGLSDSLLSSFFSAAFLRYFFLSNSFCFSKQETQVWTPGLCGNFPHFAHSPAARRLTRRLSRLTRSSVIRLLLSRDEFGVGEGFDPTTEMTPLGELVIAPGAVNVS